MGAENEAPTYRVCGGVIRVFLCGDVMIGRGIDQILPHPCPPLLHEPYVRSALDYVDLAERRSGPLPRAVPLSYVWGCALEEFEARRPDARLINLETSITLSECAEPKGINYRVSPQNAECLRFAGIDCCILANNHVLDFGVSGLLDTVRNLSSLRIVCAGAGRTEELARRPAIVSVGGGRRVTISAFALTSSGTPLSCAAKNRSAGLAVFDDESPNIGGFLAESFNHREVDDIAIASIHCGGNWGYGVNASHVEIARRCVNDFGVSIVHGHSSHHPRPFAFYRNRLILYGCGDLLNDHEGMSGHADFRSELVLMYFADVDATTGEVLCLSMVPLRLKGFRLIRPSRDERKWAHERLARICEPFGTQIRDDSAGAFVAYPRR